MRIRWERIAWKTRPPRASRRAFRATGRGAADKWRPVAVRGVELEGSPDVSLSSLGARNSPNGENGGRYAAEYRTVGLGDAPVRWVEARGHATFDALGKATRFAGTVVDIAARKRTQDFERQLIGIVSHDLRNPLNTILLGAVGLLRREVLDASGTKAVVRIRNAAERAARMIRDLLDFTKARLGGGLHVECRSTDLHVLTQEVLEEVQASHPGREIEVTLEGDGWAR